MKFRQTIIAVATTAALAVIPTTVAFASYDKDCKDGSQWRDYKYSAQCECKDDHDKDHRDHDKDYGDRDKRDHRDDSKKDEAKPMAKKTSYTGRVLKTN